MPTPATRNGGRVLPSAKNASDSSLVAAKSGEAQRKDRKHPGDLLGIPGAEGSALVDDRDERRRDPDEAGGGGQRQHQHEAAGLPEYPTESVRVTAAGGAGKRRQGGARQGDSDEPGGKLYEAVGHREPGEPGGSGGSEVPRNDER